MAGLLEHFDISSDTFKQLKQAIKITQAWNHRVTHYRTGVDMRGIPYMIFMWANSNGRCQALPAPLDDAKVIAEQIWAWLRTAEYGPEDDTDGHCNKGWHINMQGPKIGEHENSYSKEKYPSYDHTFYDVFCVQPHWITYDK